VIGTDETSRPAGKPAPGRPGAAIRGRLSADAIAAEGLRLARDGDLPGLTVKRIADALGVTPMALYRYFPSKAELMAAILDAFIRQADLTGHGVDLQDWRAWLGASFGGMHEALLNAPGILRLLVTEKRFGEAALEVTDRVLGVLRGAGLDEDEATEAFALLLGHTLGSAALESAFRRNASDLDEEPAERQRQIEARFAGLSRRQHPHIVATAPQLARLALRYPFETGLERILVSLEPATARST
jgi:AcrR family transcriptional regulator